MAKHRFHIVDVFGETKYSGNQLAVVLPGRPMATQEMQAIAREFNFPETTFIESRVPKRGGYPVRIFTPRSELPFAGHPTLGTAYVIRNHLATRKMSLLSLDLKVGRIPVRFPKSDPGIAWMRQKTAEFGAVHSLADGAALVGLAPEDLDARYPVQEVSTGMAFLLIPVKNLAAIQRAVPNRAACRAYFAQQTSGELPLFLFCPETYDPANQINARMFAEALGIPEDPATGSANGCLAAYLAQHLYWGSKRIEARVEQGYEIGRPSLLRLSADLDQASHQIEVGGRVIEIATGRLS
jgi:trans-2,3-dihydro-3-hydroxyanthranilate isomerase